MPEPNYRDAKRWLELATDRIDIAKEACTITPDSDRAALQQGIVRTRSVEAARACTSAARLVGASVLPPTEPPEPPEPEPEPEPPAGEVTIEELSFPTPDKVDWVVEPGKLTNVHSGEVTETEYPVATLYRDYYLEDGWDTSATAPTIGVKGRHLHGLPFATGSRWDPKTIYAPTGGDTFADMNVRLVGLDDTAEFQGLGTGDQYGRVVDLELYNIALRNGHPGNKAPLHQLSGALRTVVIKNVALLGYINPNTNEPEGWHGAGAKWGMHFDRGVDTFYWADCPRGMAMPGVPQRYLEHVAYIKHMGAVQVVRNCLEGGNRTGFQYRSHTGGAGPRPYGDVLVRGNYADAYGTDWGEGGAGGGSCITLWSNPDHLTLIENNVITNARYGCCVVVQAADSFVNASGHAHGRVVIRNNEFDQHPERTDSRVPFSVSGCSEVDIEGPWDVTPTNTWPWDVHLALDDEWSALVGNAPPNGIERIHEPLPEGYGVTRHDGEQTKLMTQDEVEALYV